MIEPQDFRLNLTRRHFLAGGAHLLGTAALATLAAGSSPLTAAAASLPGSRTEVTAPISPLSIRSLARLRSGFFR